jgi:hypothetical protein
MGGDKIYEPEEIEILERTSLIFNYTVLLILFLLLCRCCMLLWVCFITLSVVAEDREKK